MMAQLVLVVGEAAEAAEAEEVAVLPPAVEPHEAVVEVETFRIKVRRAVEGFPRVEPPHKALEVLNAAQVGRLEEPRRNGLETLSSVELLHSRQGEPVRRTRLSASKLRTPISRNVSRPQNPTSRIGRILQMRTGMGIMVLSILGGLPL
ncbi:MAG: hypothetical protein ACLQBD_08645 [Syntrophobacteraceae bacterium]